MSKENIFVFVVCGDDKHIKTLNFSLKYLKHFSKNKILVVTDLTRNNIPVNHDKIIDIRTPLKFNHHQASIYIKTRLHKILDLNHNYCYLDSDVIAIRKDVDKIFEYQYGPVTFASDHSAIDEFSPYAINCNCLKNNLEKQKLFYNLQKKFDPNYKIKDPVLKSEMNELSNIAHTIKKRPVAHINIIVKYIWTYILPIKYFKLNKKFKFDKTNRTWLNNKDDIIYYDVLNYYKNIEKNSNFKLKKINKRWTDKNGKDICVTPKCNHLIMNIKKKFNVRIKKNNWKHWNGGVFLFNKSSVEFMDMWHFFTMEIFSDKKWVIRDQGTLAATTWKLGLQNQKRLPQEFNFIADFYNHNLLYDKNLGFSTDNFKSYINPYFVHVYHGFGKKEWHIWNLIENILTKN